ncbi:hypothetical protein [Burkholderia territorii]|uniref:Uncharacterized protein n=1 Tax=Burkholderia territorii TaxID=1503055 RepID=A0A6L3NNY4_9BURK|nr:hypothetical protein [Burkholderia territorii]KAB0686471.1 hypothetical protein F7R13_00510 [Burkholderia territorii]MBM2775681.1 hypothetical protein [Burkholderia territorii]
MAIVGRNFDCNTNLAIHSSRAAARCPLEPRLENPMPPKPGGSTANALQSSIPWHFRTERTHAFDVSSAQSGVSRIQIDCINGSVEVFTPHLYIEIEI